MMKITHCEIDMLTEALESSSRRTNKCLLLFEAYDVENTSQKIHFLVEKKPHKLPPSLDANKHRYSRKIARAIISAIKDHSVVKIRFLGDKLKSRGTREAELYAMGPSAFSDKYLIRAWQKSGPSGSDKNKGWKTYRVSRIASVDPTGETFVSPINQRDPSAKRYKAGTDRMMKNVDIYAVFDKHKQAAVNEASLGIHGAGMTEKDLLMSLGYGGIEIEKSGPVTDEEADRIAKKIAAELPDRIYAYSRGAAALGKAFKDDDMPGSPPPVTLVAPASLRSQWGSQDVPKLPAGSVTVTGDRDASIPVKQACKIAKRAGTPLYVHPKKSHKSILYTRGDLAGAEQIDVDKCLADEALPDWGDVTVDKNGPEVEAQVARVQSLVGESLLRSIVREIILARKGR